MLFFMSLLKLSPVFFTLFLLNNGVFAQPKNWRVALSNRNIYYLDFYKGDSRIKSFKLDGFTDQNKIEDAKLLAYKKIRSIYYVLLWYSCPSNISNRQGYCGAGYEDFVAKLRISQNLRINLFEPLQVGSCFENIDKAYSFDKNHPEKGFILTDQ